jgi:hypothetical protein
MRVQEQYHALVMSMASISAFQADREGSNPSWRTGTWETLVALAGCDPVRSRFNSGASPHLQDSGFLEVA